MPYPHKTTNHRHQRTQHTDDPECHAQTPARGVGPSLYEASRPRDHIPLSLPKKQFSPLLPSQPKKKTREPKGATFWVTTAPRQSPTPSPNPPCRTPWRGAQHRVGWTPTTAATPPPTFNSPRLTERGPPTKKIAHFVSPVPFLVDLARLNLAHTREERSTLRLRVDRTQCAALPNGK